MKRYLKMLIVFLPALLWVNAEGDPLDVYEMATENNIFVGARAAGMGGAQIAAGDDGSSIWYNPALLSRIRRIELSGALTHQRFFNQTIYGMVNSNQAQLNNTRLSSIWAVFPVPVEQGGLAFALAANRIKSFDRIFRFENKPGWFESGTGSGIGGGEDDIGGLWVYSIGSGIEVSRRTSLGISLDLYSGNDKYSYIEDEITDSSFTSIRWELKDSYSGYSAKVGLAYSVNPHAHFGAAIKFPTSLTVEQEESIYRGEYKYTLPFSFGVGALFVIRDLLITGDINYTDYTQLEYVSGLELADAHNDVKLHYHDVIAMNLGLEYFLPKWGLTLRTGYCVDPIPFTYFTLDDDLDVFTVGFGYLLDRTLKLDVAVNFLNWTRCDPYFNDVGTVEKYKAQRVFLGFTYRI